MKKLIQFFTLILLSKTILAQSYIITPKNTTLNNSNSLLPLRIGMQSGGNGAIDFLRGGLVSAGIMNTNVPKQLRFGIGDLGIADNSVITIDSTTRFVGIRTNSPLAQLHIEDGNNTQSPANASQVFVRSSGDANLSLMSGSNFKSRILFQNGFGTFQGIESTSNTLKLFSNTTNSITINGIVPKITLSGFTEISNGNSGVTKFTNTSLFVENNDHNYLHLGAADGFDNGILFSNANDNPSFGGGIIYKSDDRMSFVMNGGTSRMLINSSGNIGIGTTTPSAKLDINGDIIIRKKTVLPNTTQTVNNLNRNGASVICTGVATSAQTITITGIDGGVDGMMLWIYPTNFFTIRLENEDTGSTAINRIKTTTGTANILSARGGATLIYDGTEERWHVIDTN